MSVTGRPFISRLAPNHFNVIGGELAVAWSDGAETFFKLETLRRNCPCAVCQGEADVLGEVERPARHYSESSFQIKAIQSVGGYALQPLWGDGHGTGLYSFAYLRQMASSGAPVDQP